MSATRWRMVEREECFDALELKSFIVTLCALCTVRLHGRQKLNIESISLVEEISKDI